MTKRIAGSEHLRHWRLDSDEKNIVWLRLDQAAASTNTLGREVMGELAQALELISPRRPRALILYSGKKNGFAVGADIGEFTHIHDEAEAYRLVREGQAVLDRLAALACPTVAMLHGFVLGGGLELALACHYRIATATQELRLGFPEVRLGIHPGFGGTVRAIALAGVLPAMDLMLTGRSIKAHTALGIGLVDKLASREELRERAINLALSLPARYRAPWPQRALALPGLRYVVARWLTGRLRRKVREAHYPAPYALVQLWRRHGGRVRPASFEAEAHSFAGLVCATGTRNLVRVFFLQKRLKGLGRASGFKPRRVHVFGTGTMGGDIAAWCAARGFNVTLQDRDSSAMEGALERADEYFQHRFQALDAIATARSRLRLDPNGDALPDADLVIEAIDENREAKCALFHAIEPCLGEDTLLATNTSSIPLETLAVALEQPSRLIGLHFFNPVAHMPLVEVVSSDMTADSTIQRALAAVRAIGKLPLPVAGSPGFLVNRVLAPYLVTALAIWSEGVTLEAIDRAAEDFGMPMGPAELADTIGLDVALSVAEVIREKLPVPPPDKIRELVRLGRFGRKSGHGLYAWEEGHAIKNKHKGGKIDPLLQDRLMFPLLNVAVSCLREGVVGDADLLDAGVIFGTGFAPFRGGPIHYIRACGTEHMRRRLDELATRYGKLYSPDPGWKTL